MKWVLSGVTFEAPWWYYSKRGSVGDQVHTISHSQRYSPISLGRALASNSSDAKAGEIKGE